MGLPRKREICGRMHTVKLVAPEDMPTADGEDDRHHVGYCDSATCTIYISKALGTGEARLGTLDHETAHGAAEESGARHIMEQYAPGRSDELEEMLCRVWIPAILAACKPVRKR